MKRIGIFSGTFDPVHDGHLAFAEEAIRTHELEKVVFLPERRPRRKPHATDYEHRTAMLKHAIKDSPQFDLLEADHDQFEPEKTLNWLSIALPNSQFFMLLGVDVVANLRTWPKVAEAFKNVPIILADRRGIGASGLSSSQIRAKLIENQEPHGLHEAVSDYIKQNGLYTLALLTKS